MNKLSKEKRDRLLLVAFAITGVLAALYLLVVSAQQTALQGYADQIEGAKEKLAKAERWLRMAPGIQARLADSRSALEAKQEHMAPLDKFKWFHATLEKFMAPHRVKLIDITREPEVGELQVLPKFPYQAASFGVKLTARYHDFGAFVADFENHFPYMRVQNVELAPDGASKLVGKDVSRVVDRRASSPESLAITMRVVTLIKPIASL
jgi:hypothetical protein